MDQVKNWIIGDDEAKPIKLIGTKDMVKRLLVKMAQETFKTYKESTRTETVDDVDEFNDGSLQVWVDNGWSYEDNKFVFITAYPEDIINPVTLTDEIINSYPDWLYNK